ncbi:MAG TPA: energy transducer TonB [Sandaracinaceae bacterium LLY-WYZ-13_1]|nr:energy transducer TonB [Sandaracinaceae bacterium LLY-WYZ-13_1]
MRAPATHPEEPDAYVPPRAAARPSERTEPGWVLPAVLVLSVFAHGVVLALSALLPGPAASLASSRSELSFEVLPDPETSAVEEPVEQEEREPPEPEEPEEVAPAAVVDRPVRRTWRPEPEEAPDDEPPPPAEVMTTEGEEAGGDWAHPEGEEDGALGGSQGGEGTGGALEGAPAEEAAAPEPEPRISRAELRRRLLGYMRSTLWSFVNGRIDYPLAARREHLEGVVVLRIRLAHDGRLLEVRLSRSSGHDMLDRAALASVERLESMPAPPDSIPWDDDRELPLPVTYQLVR